MSAPDGAIQSDEALGIDHPHALALARATEASARAAAQWLGSGEPIDLSRAARIAMKRKLDEAPFAAEIVIGDGPDDTNHTSPLSIGKRIGPSGVAATHELALDPTEGASFLVHGQTNALSVAALAPPDTFLRPGPAFYMAKVATSREVQGLIDPTAPVSEILATTARALGKQVKELTVFVLEKSRHRRLIEEIEHAGARVALFPAGDVAGALMAATPDSGIDLMIGTGGSSEGIISAAAIRALDGVFMARFDPQLATEHIAVREAGLDTARWMEADTLAQSTDILIAATGITTGILLDGIAQTFQSESAQTMILSGATGDRCITTTYRPAGTGPEYVDSLEAYADAIE
ncbi:MAG: fructose-bisphosphatase class II [Rhodospirillales bacterium]